MDRENSTSFKLLKTKLDKISSYFDEQTLYVILKLLYAPPDVSRILDFRYGMGSMPYMVLLAFLWLYVHYNLDISSLIDGYKSRIDSLKDFKLHDTNKFNDRLDAAWKFLKDCYPGIGFSGRMPTDYNDLIRSGDGRVMWGQQFDLPKFPRSGKSTLQKDLEKYLSKFRNDELKSESVGVIILSYQEIISTLCRFINSLLLTYKKSEIVFDSRNYLDFALGQRLDVVRPITRVLEGLLELLSLQIVSELKNIQDETYMSGLNAHIGFNAVLSLAGDPEKILNLEYIKKKIKSLSPLPVIFDKGKKVLTVGNMEIVFIERDRKSVFSIIKLAELIDQYYPEPFDRIKAYALYEGSYDEKKRYKILDSTVKALNKKLINTRLRIILNKPNIDFAFR